MHNFIARYVSQRIAEKLSNALVYPIMPFGPTGDIATKTNHMRFPGSVVCFSGHLWRGGS
jgi:creatinine amidohydrolase/Fe(II)-dependent formamide hydrolase-like protein